MCDQDKFRDKVLLNYRFVFRFMFKIYRSIQIKLFINQTDTHGKTDGETDRHEPIALLLVSLHVRGVIMVEGTEGSLAIRGPAASEEGCG